MKKITEAQLKDKVSSLREYLKVYEAAAEADPNEIPFDPTWGGTKAPADTRNFWQRNAPNFLGGQDAPQAANKNATWNNAQQAAVSNQPKAPPDLANMDIGFGPGKFAPDDTNQAASVTPAAPSTQDLTAAASASGEAVGKSLQQFKELLAKAMAPAAAAATNSGSSYTGSVGNATNESTTHFLNKLRLIESRQLHEALTAEEEKQLDTLAQSYGDSEDPEIAGLMKQYSDYKNSKQTAPNQAAAVTPAAPAAPAGPINRDSMTFGQAFADARKKGEKQFNWKGKPYAVKLAPPKPKTPVDPTAKTKAALPNNMSYDQYQQSMNRSEEDPAQAASVTPAVDPNADARKNAGRPGYDEAGTPVPRSKVTAESVGYNELQRIVSLVNHR